MYKNYATVTLVLHTRELPTTLFEVAARMKICSDNYQFGESHVARLRNWILPATDRKALYEKRVLEEPLNQTPHSILWDSDAVDNNVFQFDNNYETNETYEQMPWIQPSDIVIDAYTFPNLAIFATLIPQAEALWGEDDVRTQHMVTTLAGLTNSQYLIQRINVLGDDERPNRSSEIRNVADGSLVELRLNPFEILNLPVAAYHHLSAAQLETLIYAAYPQSIAKAVIDSFKGIKIDVPLAESDIDWMGNLRVRDNHFRSEDDVFFRVTMPLAKYFHMKCVGDYYRFTKRNSCGSIDMAPINILCVKRHNDSPMNCATSIVVKKRIVPVFIREQAQTPILMCDLYTVLSFFVGTVKK